MIYNVFISHSWTYSDSYEKLLNLLNSDYTFNYKNYSVPKNNPIHNAPYDYQLKNAIQEKMKHASCILILAGVYSTYSKWINIEIEIAKKYQKPIVIHARDAYEDTYNILKQTAHYGIMHCYSGSVEMAKRYIDIGFEISLAGPVTFKNAKVPKEVAQSIDIEHLMIETDCPYLTPHPFRGKLNEPANVVYIAQEIAKLKNMEIEDVARITTFNAKKMFGIK